MYLDIALKLCLRFMGDGYWVVYGQRSRQLHINKILWVLTKTEMENASHICLYCIYIDILLPVNFEASCR